MLICLEGRLFSYPTKPKADPVPIQVVLEIRIKFYFKSRPCTTIHCLNSKQGQQAVWCYKNAGKMRSKSDSIHMSSAWTNCSMSRQSRRFRHFIAHSCPTSEMSRALSWFWNVWRTVNWLIWELFTLVEIFFFHITIMWPMRYFLSCDKPLQNIDWQLYWKPWVWSY